MPGSGSKSKRRMRKEEEEAQQLEYHSSDSSDSGSSSDSSDSIDSDSDNESIFDMSQDSGEEEEHKMKVCKITNEDIAQAFALFDFRLRQIAKKVGADLSPIPATDVVKDVKNDDKGEGKKTGVTGSLPMIFPDVPMSMEEYNDDGDQKLPPVFRNVRFGKS